MKKIAAGILALVFASGAWAGQGDGAGTVVDIKKDAGRIKLDHGPVEGLMDPMVMEFDLMDPAMLDGISTGDKINFTLKESGGGSYVISDIQVSGKGSVAADN